jgi:hypothetical protein
MMRNTMCIEDQYGIHVVYQHRIDVPFGLLFNQYLRSKGILPRGGLFLSSRKMIRLDETPKSMGFDTDYHVIIFVNLLMSFYHNDLEYQSNYLLTGGNDRGGVLDVHTMRDGINALIQRGHVIEVLPKEDELLPSPHKQYRVQEKHKTQFCQWSLYTAHQSAVVEFGDRSKKDVLLEFEITVNLVRLQKPVD